MIAALFRRPATLAHNREKHRLLSLERPFLRALGVTDNRGHLIPSMARKWKQINRFIEVFADAWRSSGLQQREAPLRVIDFGAGKGYLTFALHDYLRTTLEVDCCTHGVDLRGDLVKTCNDAVAALGIEGLAFSQGDIASHRTHTLQGAPGGPAYDVMIALHACDTATDDAIHQGIRAGAAIIMWQHGAHMMMAAPARMPWWMASSVAVSQACSAIMTSIRGRPGALLVLPYVAGNVALAEGQALDAERGHGLVAGLHQVAAQLDAGCAVDSQRVAQVVVQREGQVALARAEVDQAQRRLALLRRQIARRRRRPRRTG